TPRSLLRSHFTQAPPTLGDHAFVGSILTQGRVRSERRLLANLSLDPADRVSSGSTVVRVDARAADHPVIAPITEKLILSDSPKEPIAPLPAERLVAPPEARGEVVARPSGQLIPAIVPEKLIIAGTSGDTDQVCGWRRDQVVAPVPFDENAELESAVPAPKS